MKRILDKYHYRQLFILDRLHESDSWVTSKELSQELNVSERTITEDFAKINQLWGQNILLECSKYLGYKLNNLPRSIEFIIKSDILLDTVPIQFIELLFFKPNKNITFYANELHISTSTLYRYLTMINDSMKEYNLEIRNHLTTYYLFSYNELSLRVFMTNFFQHIYGFDSSKFINSSESLFIKNRIDYLLKKNKLTIAKNHFTHYHIFYFVSLIRQSQNFTILPIEHYKGKELTLKKNDLDFIEHQFPKLDFDTILEIEKSILIHHVKTSTIIDKTEILDAIKEIVTSTFSQLIQKENKENELSLLITYLQNVYLMGTLYPDSKCLFYTPYYSFSLQIKKRYPTLYYQTQDSLLELSKKADYSFINHFDELLFIIILKLPSVLNVPHVFDDKPTNNVLIISSYSEKHAYFLKKIISEQLSSEANRHTYFDCKTTYNMKEADLLHYSLVISCSSKIELTEKTILINDFPTTYDIERIELSLTN